MMHIQQLDRVSVLGAGVLGGQIAWHSAYQGKTVVVYDISDEALENCRRAQQQYASIYQQDLGAEQAAIEATRARLSFTTDISLAAAVDLVIEAVPEIPEVKTSVYQMLAPHLPPHTLVATNSSTLLPADFAEATGRPSQYCALHFANLVWALNLAEVMAHPGTADDTIAAITGFAIDIGMVPIPVQKAQHGYVLNSWFVPLLNAAMSLLSNGIATPETIDKTFMITNRCAMGPCALVDMVGMETAFNVATYWGTVNGDEQMLANAAYIKEHFIDKGLMGLQAGRGFYSYPDPAYEAADFLSVPAKSTIAEIVRLTRLA
jgi:3-hydroxybutyryl-CoA dehydrogenase